MPPQERLKHRAWIGVRIEALLDGYWSSRPSEAVKAEILADWMDALENFTPDEIRAACRQYIEGPDRSRKPKTGDLIEMLVAKRTEIRRSLPKPPEPPSPVLSVPQEERRKQAAEIMARFKGASDGSV